MTMRGRKQRGFTLIELVAALAIFALLSAMAYGGLASIIETRRSVGVVQERMADWQRGIYRLRSDLESAVVRPARDAFGDPQPALYRNELGGLEFTTGGRRNPLQLPRSSLSRVEYLLAERSLVRRSWREVDRVQGDEGLAYPVLEGIDELTWRFLGDSGEWVEEWPPLDASGGAAPGLPRAVELILISQDYGELRFAFALAPA